MKKNISSFLRYLIPGLLSVVLLSAYIFTDGFVVGQKLGSVALGAMGICTPILTISYAFGAMFGMGGGSLYSIEIGKNDKNKARRIFSTVVIFALILSTIFAILGNIFIEQISYFLGADETNIQYAIDYNRCIFCFIPGFFLNSIFGCFMRNDGHPNIAMASSLVGNILNVILDFVFVYGFEWGIFWAAAATVLCSCISAFVNFVSTYILKMNIRFSFKFVDFSLIFPILKNGLSSLLSDASNGVVTFIFIANAIRLYGTEGSSIYTIIMNWAIIFVCVQGGISQSAQPLISRSFGEGSASKVQTFRKYAFVSSVIAAVLCTLVTLIFTKPLIDVFGTDNESVTKQTILALRLYSPAFLFMSIGIIFSGTFQAIGKYKQASVLQSLRGFILPFILSITFSLLFGKTGLWLSMPISEILVGILAVILMKKNRLAM